MTKGRGLKFLGATDCVIAHRYGRIIGWALLILILIPIVDNDEGVMQVE